MPDNIPAFFMSDFCINIRQRELHRKLPLQKEKLSRPTTIVSNCLRLSTQTITAISDASNCGFRQCSSSPLPCGASIIGVIIAVSTVTGTKLSARFSHGGKTSLSPRIKNRALISTVTTAIPPIIST
jgi:hypothetical protein